MGDSLQLISGSGARSRDLSLANLQLAPFPSLFCSPIFTLSLSLSLDIPLTLSRFLSLSLALALFLSLFPFLGPARPHSQVLRPHYRQQWPLRPTSARRQPHARVEPGEFGSLPHFLLNVPYLSSFSLFFRPRVCPLADFCVNGLFVATIYECSSSTPRAWSPRRCHHRAGLRVFLVVGDLFSVVTTVVIHEEIHTTQGHGIHPATTTVPHPHLIFSLVSQGVLVDARPHAQWAPLDSVVLGNLEATELL